MKSSAKPKATNKATPGRSRRVPTNKSNPAQDVATPPSVPIITAASSTCDLRRRYASLNRNRRPSTGPPASSCSASASTRSATRARRVERNSEQRRDSGKQEDGRERDLDNVRNAVDAFQAEHLSSSCGDRAGLSKPTLLRQLLPIPRRLFKTPLSASSFAVPQGAYLGPDEDVRLAIPNRARAHLRSIS